MKFYFALCLFLVLAIPGSAATTTYAATNVGPYRSTDGSVTWQSVKVTVPNALLQGVPDVVAIAVDPLNPAKVYFLGAVTGTSAFFRSTDEGQTWSAALLPGVGVGSGTRANYWLCIDPVATNNLYIQAANKVLRSTDSGVTWAETPALAAVAGVGGVIGIATDPNTSGILYATHSGAGISKSVDFGNTWTTVKLPYGAPPTLGGIFVDPVNSQRLYVARRFGQGCLDTSRVFVDCGLFRSADAGKTWERVPIPGTAQSVAFDRITGDIYAGANLPGVGDSVVKSSDQGRTWNPLLKNAGGNDGPNVSVDPGAAGNVYSNGDGIVGGLVQKTTDGGATWKKVTVPPYCTGFSSPSCPSPGTPRVNGLAYVSAATAPALATLSAAGVQNGPVAAESIVTAKGSHLATGSANADVVQPPTALAGTTVSVTDSSGVTRPALLLSVSPTQVIYQIPAGTALGAATLTIKSGDGVTSTGQLQVASVAPGVYTLNPDGLVKAFALRVSNGIQFVEDVYEIDATGAVIAHPITISNGDQVYLIAYGTGFRAANADVAVTIGEISAPVLYAGPQGVAAGMDQFNILVPPDLAAGGQRVVSLILTAAGQVANTVNLTVR